MFSMSTLLNHLTGVLQSGNTTTAGSTTTGSTTTTTTTTDENSYSYSCSGGSSSGCGSSSDDEILPPLPATPHQSDEDEHDLIHFSSSSEEDEIVVTGFNPVLIDNYPQNHDGWDFEENLVDTRVLDMDIDVEMDAKYNNFLEAIAKNEILENEILENEPLEKGAFLTENGALSYSTVYDARVELFFKAVRGLNGDNLVRMLESSWSENPLDTLRIIFQARDCRGGKGERQLFLDCIEWLSTKSVQNVLVNMELIPEYGRWLDLVQVAENHQVAEAIWVMLARQLREDHEQMMNGKPVSLCAKWIPTEGSKWDRKLRATRNVARALGINLQDLRREYLTPLRSYLKIVEHYMCERHWNEIDYSKVPSRAMFKLKNAFARNDPVRFAEWMRALEHGRPDAKVNAKVLFPHELVNSYLSNGSSKLNQVTESQWKVLLEETQKLGNLGRSLAICDVSGSMTGIPLQVSIALGLMISQCATGPFRNQVITFSNNPEFYTIKGVSLYDQVTCLHQASWEMSTDFIAVFKLILSKAQEHGVPPANMPNRLYVFSDMQFDNADNGNFTTNYEEIRNMYSVAGYQMPEMVFWNLRSDTLDFPVGDAQTKGVAMVSGFTTSILKALLNGRELSPVTVMQDALNCERYKSIRYLI